MSLFGRLAQSGAQWDQLLVRDRWKPLSFSGGRREIKIIENWSQEGLKKIMKEDLGDCLSTKQQSLQFGSSRTLQAVNHLPVQQGIVAFIGFMCSLLGIQYNS